MTKPDLNAISERGYKRFLKSAAREQKKKAKRRADHIFNYNARQLRYSKGEPFYFRSKKQRAHPNKPKPEYPENSKFVLSKSFSFSTIGVKWYNKGIITLPINFSLTKSPAESYLVLKNLIYLLYKGKYDTIVLDYGKCIEIDLDASICMDILVMEYNQFLNRCKLKGFIPTVKNIKPINFNCPEVTKVLFSIGAFRNVKQLKIDYEDIICYNLRVRSKYVKSDSGVDITKMVDYVQDCLKRMQKSLNTDKRKNLCDVIGEILINAEEHSTTNHCFSIGYFQDSTKENNHTGIFNLVIFNFGDTIYEKFKSPSCQNLATIGRMQELSEIYTKKSFFGKTEFTEETLWTLYALQEGVTSVPKEKYIKRGNGSIRFIESFFELKGTGMQMDDVSKLTILSGNTKIVFNGAYEIMNKNKKGINFKIMAFNNAGEIEEKPDKKYVSFVENYFPGTLISAKILISENDTQKAEK